MRRARVDWLGVAALIFVMVAALALAKVMIL
jgi:predicted nucleic acid-binding Zn ribbon protein